MNTKLLYSACITALSLLLVSCIFPKYRETEWHVRPDGSILLKQYSYDMHSPASHTNKAREAFIKLVKDMEPPILTPTPDPDNEGITINLRELQEKYGGVNIMQESLMKREKALELMAAITSNGYYWMEFDTNEVSIETNGELVRHPESQGIVVRWPTNMVYLWYKETTIEEKGISLVGFWREYCAKGQDLAAFGTNEISQVTEAPQQ